ncbi:MAG: DUF2461 domain-containing protein [bacterium]|nr:DUF2461 domain-containing protein [bacterium]
MTDPFNGFAKRCVEFLVELAANNNREWFAEHKQDFDESVMEPARQFVVAMGEALHDFAPGVAAEPRVDRSIFRIYRDVRFSKDKSPYKTNLGLWFWEGDLPRKECSGFYFHLEPPTLMLAVGTHMFGKETLAEYRKSVVHQEFSVQLSDAIDVVTDGPYTIGGKHYKRVPRGFDPNDANSDLLRHNGLYAATEIAIPDEFYSPEIIAFCAKKYRDMSPIHKWLVGLTGRVSR